MKKREDNRDIDDQAADWVAREDRAALTPADKAELQTWLEGDPRRPGSLLRARAIFMRSGSARVLEAQYDLAPLGRRRLPSLSSPTRRQVLGWGGGMAAAAAAAAAPFTLQAPKAYLTTRGEIRRIPLADGSTITLNTDTRVEVKYSEASRFANLVHGEVDFSVLADGRGPFVVEVDDFSFMTADGAFRLRKLERQPVDVMVHEGNLSVSARDIGAGRPVSLASHTRLLLPPDAPWRPASLTPRPVSHDVLERELAWREGKIAFQGETLSEAAAQFARYSDVRIVLADPSLAAEPVAGLYSANDPVGFSHAVASLFGAQVVQRGSNLMIIRTAK